MSKTEKTDMEVLHLLRKVADRAGKSYQGALSLVAQKSREMLLAKGWVPKPGDILLHVYRSKKLVYQFSVAESVNFQGEHFDPRILGKVQAFHLLPGGKRGGGIETTYLYYDSNHFSNGYYMKAGEYSLRENRIVQMTNNARSIEEFERIDRASRRRGGKAA